MEEHLPFFVYGTLKRGEVRERCWPHPASDIVAATTRGALYALASYPALLPGDDAVSGELWFIRASHMAETLRVLDAIEGFRQGDDIDLYVRDIADCVSTDGAKYRAYLYYYVQPVEPSQRIAPNDQNVCLWTASQNARGRKSI